MEVVVVTPAKKAAETKPTLKAAVTASGVSVEDLTVEEVAATPLKKPAAKTKATRKATASHIVIDLVAAEKPAGKGVKAAGKRAAAGTAQATPKKAKGVAAKAASLLEAQEAADKAGYAAAAAATGAKAKIGQRTVVNKNTTTTYPVYQPATPVKRQSKVKHRVNV
ncbi:hypothetical protein WJX72_002608 [[Myrmecia] bisecta]|uniref:Uncharacterized protein n=1 Tax=[Myrmecia] bisecta TaxID=41462 RepID=A0AAW1P5K7_9CHLO